jgi:flagellar motor switch/type III secretory pathway protein FliN
LRRQLRIELGRKWLSAEEAAALDVGKSIELDSLANEAVDVLVDGRLVARGEPAVMDGEFCVRVWDMPEAHPAADERPRTDAAVAGETEESG